MGGRVGVVAHRLGRAVGSRRRKAVLLGALLGVLLGAPIPAQASDGDAGTGDVSLTARGEVSLTNDSRGAAMFPLGHPLAPGHPWQACIQVTATATDPPDVVTFGATEV